MNLSVDLKPRNLVHVAHPANRLLHRDQINLQGHNPLAQSNFKEYMTKSSLEKTPSYVTNFIGN